MLPSSCLEEEVALNSDFGPGGRNLEEEITEDLGRNHLGPAGRNLEEEIGRKKSLRTCRKKLDFNSDLEEEIGNMAVRTWREKLVFN